MTASAVRLLPLPDSPTSPTRSPARMSKLTSITGNDRLGVVASLEADLEIADLQQRRGHDAVRTVSGCGHDAVRTVSGSVMTRSARSAARS